MTETIIYWEPVNSCEGCPGTIREMHETYRCKHDVSIVFKSNRDMGVPATCPKRNPP